MTPAGRLTIRADDKPETVLERLKVYHDQTEPLKAFYKERGMLHTVESQEELKGHDGTNVSYHRGVSMIVLKLP